jgi:hypothetical protein
MKVQDIFTLGRLVDKDYLTNQLIVFITAIVFIAGIIIHLFRQGSAQNSFVFGILISIIIFLTWALAREVFPQVEYAALAASAVCFLGLIYYGITPLVLLVLLWLTICLRLINQTTGLKPSIVDRVIVFIISIICAYVLSWILLLVLVLVFIVNYFLSKEKSDIVFMIAAIFSIPIIILLNDLWNNSSQFTPINILPVVLLLVGFIIAMWFVRNIAVLGDNSQKKVPVSRIFSAQIISVIFCSLYFIWVGNKGFVELIPFWCIFASSIIFSPIELFLNRKNVS